MTASSLLHSRARVILAALVFAFQGACSGGSDNTCPLSSPACGNTPRFLGATISGTLDSLISVGQSGTLSIAVEVKDGPPQIVTWSSSDSRVLGFSADGNSVVVTGLAEGRATITATLHAEGSTIEQMSIAKSVTVRPSTTKAAGTASSG